MNTENFYNSIRQSLFKGSISPSQLDGLTMLISEWNKYPNNQDKRRLAYIMATIYHESGHKFQPVREYGSDAYLRSKKYFPYYGRDLVQTTWKWNYQKVKDFSGIDVVSQPDLIGQMPLAARVAIVFMDRGWYTGKKLSDYFNETTEHPIDARRIINGVDCNTLIAGYYHNFLQGLI